MSAAPVEHATGERAAGEPATGERVTIADVRLSPAEAGLLATERYSDNRLSEAETLCRSWLSVQPEASEALHLLGVICLDSGRRHEAQELLQRASTIAPSNANIRRNLGSALSLLGQPEQAIAQFEVGAGDRSRRCRCPPQSGTFTAQPRPDERSGRRF